jgi:hypothetical protein
MDNLQLADIPIDPAILDELSKSDEHGDIRHRLAQNLNAPPETLKELFRI